MADWQVGDIEVTSVLEQVAEFMTLEEFFDGFTPEMFEANKDWLIPDAVSPTSRCTASANLMISLLFQRHLFMSNLLYV